MNGNLLWFRGKLFITSLLGLLLVLTLGIRIVNSAPSSEDLESVVLAGGCFWCIESDFEKLGGITDVVSGYAGGQLINPTYEQVSAGGTGHLEVVKVTYNKKKLSYKQVLEYFFKHIDPFDGKGQFCDKGYQYQSAVFYKNDEQKKEFTKQSEALHKKFGHTVKTLLLEDSKFYPAEDYHQNYSTKNPLRYKYYRYRCGRDARVKEIWAS